LSEVEQLLFCRSCKASKVAGRLVLGNNDNAVGVLNEDRRFTNLRVFFDPTLAGKRVVITIQEEPTK
jgi:hypothetical protein